jgi:chemotaxis protein methyltransferase CheR
MLDRARKAVYPGGSLSELPADLKGRAFVRDGQKYRLRDSFRSGIRFLRQDIRCEMPAGPFDLLLCRNLVFTYFAEPVQRKLLSRISERVRGGGLLIVGRNEKIPSDSAVFRAVDGAPGTYRRQCR